MSSVSNFAPAFPLRQNSRRNLQHPRKGAEKRSRETDLASPTTADADGDGSSIAPLSGQGSSHDSGHVANNGRAAANASKDSLSGALADKSSGSEDESDLGDPLLRSSSRQCRQARGSVQRGSSDLVGLRKQHVAVIVAILHKSLLSGDYVRAGRAWGMLLRAKAQGRSMDVRNHDQWGIGAEILLLRETQLKRKRTEAEATEEYEKYHSAIPHNIGAHQQPSTLFSREGFIKAKDYYERLILQYPYRKTMPNAPNSMQFYPAMFGLWIYAVQENHRCVLNALKQGDDGRGVDHESIDSRRISVITLQSASEIASRLDELLVSPPYSDQANLWRLRGMVALWTTDLLYEVRDRDPAYEQDRAMLDSDSVGDQYEVERAETEQKTYRKRELDAKSKAQEAFHNVSKLLHHVPRLSRTM
ncbi:MAG: hypothetical protein Q9191_004334 [Dirinaria sp. TL-2023a]